MHVSLRFVLALTVSMGITMPVLAASVPMHDVPGSKDNPIVSRFAGSVIIGYQLIKYDEIILPLGAVENGSYTRQERVGGKITRIAYVAPEGKSGLAVFRSYLQALTAAGFVTKFRCSGDTGPHACGSAAQFANYTVGDLYETLHGNASLMIDALGATDHHTRALTAHLERPQGNVDVSLLVCQGDQAPVGILLQVVEGKPMATGQVTVDAKAMDQGLQQNGHIALYGIHFDSDSAMLKDSSGTTLTQMVKLLKSRPALKVYIVGHTDSTGTLAHNTKLSQQRANAVVTALEARGIAASRVAAKGLASYAPVASNDTAAGRARNRRVELVEQ